MLPKDVIKDEVVSKKQTKKPSLHPLHNGIQNTIQKGTAEQLKILLAASNVRIDFRTEPHYQTALYLASFHGKVEMVRILIEKNANPNIENHMGKTPLMIATELALGGHRQPNEVNPYVEIISLLKKHELKFKENREKQDITSAQKKSELLLSNPMSTREPKIENPVNNSVCTIM